MALLLLAQGVHADETEAGEVLATFDDYADYWRSDEKKARTGEAFHFEYGMSWFDSARTIAKVLIERVMPDSARGTIFEGYKGRKPDGSGVYYFGLRAEGDAEWRRVAKDIWTRVND